MSGQARMVIAAPQGRSGKTTLALGLCAAFKQRGLRVQPFKKGPDYIDPSWLSEAAGQACYPLDPFFYQPPEKLLKTFTQAAHTAEISLIEGNHGLFDSYDDTGSGSTAAVARLLQAPILLVVNAARIGRSIAAIVHGCQTFEPNTPIAAVVLNQVAHGRHEARLRQAIESNCDLPIVGAVPRNEDLTIPDRHLGLVPREEGDGLLPVILACQQAVERHLDLETILEIARSAPALPPPSLTLATSLAKRQDEVRIGILRDRVFTFYYPDNLEALQEVGAELVFLNSLHDTQLPEVDMLYIGGGFPEIFMQELAANLPLLAAIRQAVEDGLPVYAECGGLMYLSQRITWGENSAKMVGVLPCEIEMTNKPQGHGYVLAEVERENPFFKPGSQLRGHEFHNSRLHPMIKESKQNRMEGVYRLARGNGLGNGRDGIVYRNVLASYTHLHNAGAPDWASGLVQRARTHQHAQATRQGNKG